MSKELDLKPSSLQNLIDRLLTDRLPDEMFYNALFELCALAQNESHTASLNDQVTILSTVLKSGVRIDELYRKVTDRWAGQGSPMQTGDKYAALTLVKIACEKSKPLSEPKSVLTSPKPLSQVQGAYEKVITGEFFVSLGVMLISPIWENFLTFMKAEKELYELAKKSVDEKILDEDERQKKIEENYRQLVEAAISRLEAEAISANGKNLFAHRAEAAENAYQMVSVMVSDRKNSKKNSPEKTLQALERVKQILAGFLEKNNIKPSMPKELDRRGKSILSGLLWHVRLPITFNSILLNQLLTLLKHVNVRAEHNMKAGKLAAGDDILPEFIEFLKSHVSYEQLGLLMVQLQRMVDSCANAGIEGYALSTTYVACKIAIENLEFDLMRKDICNLLKIDVGAFIDQWKSANLEVLNLQQLEQLGALCKKIDPLVVLHNTNQSTDETSKFKDSVTALSEKTKQTMLKKIVSEQLVRFTSVIESEEKIKRDFQLALNNFLGESTKDRVQLLTDEVGKVAELATAKLKYEELRKIMGVLNGSVSANNLEKLRMDILKKLDTGPFADKLQDLLVQSLKGQEFSQDDYHKICELSDASIEASAKASHIQALVKTDAVTRPQLLGFGLALILPDGWRQTSSKNKSNPGLLSWLFRKSRSSAVYPSASSMASARAQTPSE